ncbi:MAG: PorT family protein [Bacteroidales bacterium]|nr:PorT family protein [Bacteroidales bacterium]
MKRLILSVLTAVMIFLSADLSAQTNGFSLHIGGTMPMGSFAQSSNAFLDYGSGKAAAANGFAIGAKAQYSFPIPIVRRLKAMLTVDLLYNGMQNEAKNNLEGYGNMDGYFETSAPSYYNIPIMAGVNLSPLVLGPIKLYGEIGMGVNFRMVSDMQRVFEVKASDGSTRQFAGTVSFDNAATFAFQLGIGLCFLNRVSVGLSYYNLGRTELKGSFTSFEGAEEMISSIANEYQEFSNGKIGTDMFVVRVGLHL